MQTLGGELSRSAQSRTQLQYTGGGGPVSVSLLELKAHALNEYGVAALREPDRAIGLSEALRAFKLAFCHAPRPLFRTNHRVSSRDAHKEVRALLREEGFDSDSERGRRTTVAELSPGVRKLNAQLPNPVEEATMFFVAPVAEREALGPRLDGAPPELLAAQWTLLGGQEGAAAQRRAKLLRDTLAPFAPQDGCGHVPPCTFLEIGTSDFDTLAQLYEHDAAWRGVSVEPLPHLLHALPVRPGLEKVNAAVGDTEGQALLYTIDPATLATDPELRSALRDAASLGGMAAEKWTRGVSSFDPEHRDVRMYNLQKWYRPRNVTVTTIAALATTAGFRRALCPGREQPPPPPPPPPPSSLSPPLGEERCAIDLIKIDAEGHDARIVLQVVAWARATCNWPRKVQFEVHHAPEAELDAAVMALSRAGYFCRYAAFDVICVVAVSQPPCAPTCQSLPLGDAGWERPAAT